MDAINKLTQAERSMLDQARKLLGDNLADFILSGLGETSLSHRRTFTARGTLSQSNRITYQLEMINDSEQGLPQGRHPLVLAVLLALLWERQPLHSTILFREADILEKLEWDNNTESKKLIKRALEKYLSTAYCLIDSDLPEEARFYGQYLSIGRLLIGLEDTAVLLSPKKINHTRSIRAHFFPTLIHDVISERKFFLGIDFQSLTGIENL